MKDVRCIFSHFLIIIMLHFTLLQWFRLPPVQTRHFLIVGMASPFWKVVHIQKLSPLTPYSTVWGSGSYSFWWSLFLCRVDISALVMIVQNRSLHVDHRMQSIWNPALVQNGFALDRNVVHHLFFKDNVSSSSYFQLKEKVPRNIIAFQKAMVYER